MHGLETIISDGCGVSNKYSIQGNIYGILEL